MGRGENYTDPPCMFKVRRSVFFVCSRCQIQKSFYSKTILTMHHLNRTAEITNEKDSNLQKKSCLAFGSKWVDFQQKNSSDANCGMSQTLSISSLWSKTIGPEVWDISQLVSDEKNIPSFEVEWSTPASSTQLRIRIVLNTTYRGGKETLFGGSVYVFSDNYVTYNFVRPLVNILSKKYIQVLCKNTTASWKKNVLYWLLGMFVLRVYVNLSISNSAYLVLFILLWKALFLIYF